jgi:hypothetical protein
LVVVYCLGHVEYGGGLLTTFNSTRVTCKRCLRGLLP